MTESLSNRTKALTYSIYGAWKYRNGFYKDSLILFEKATQISSLEDTKGLSVWYLWWGNAALKQKEYQNAYKYYQTALDYRPGYARAFIGLAETTISQTNYFLSTSGLSNTQNFIDTTNILLNNAMNATDRPASADIDIKTEFILGKIAQMKFHFFLPVDPKFLEEAEMHYQSVISAHNKRNKRITEQAGLSFMHLGEIYMARQEYALAFDNFNSALEILRDAQAIELTRSNLSLLPLLTPLQAKEQLATAIAISTDDMTDKEYQRRIDCWNSLPTPIPSNKLICP